MVEPVFEIDYNGVTICRSHSEFDEKSLREPLNLKHLNIVRIHLLPDKYKFCKTCSHYLNNDCAIPSKQIDKAYKQRGIMFGVYFNKYKCDICGSQIGNIFLILRDWYLKQQQNNSNKVICTSCQNNIIKGTLKKAMRFDLLFSLMMLLIVIGPGILLTILLFQVSMSVPYFLIIIALLGIDLVFASVVTVRLLKPVRYKRVAPIATIIEDEKMIKKKSVYFKH